MAHPVPIPVSWEDLRMRVTCVGRQAAVRVWTGSRWPTRTGDLKGVGWVPLYLSPVQNLTRQDMVDARDLVLSNWFTLPCPAVGTDPRRRKKRP